MFQLSPRFFTFFALFLLLLSTTPLAFASDDRNEREVRLTLIQGDVRLSRGNGNHNDLNKPWEEAQPGELIQTGFALATADGRAEISFEDGSAVYLAENSLLLFAELSAPNGNFVSRMTLPTGTATFSLHPVGNDVFLIETPTDNLETFAQETFYARIDSYLDSTAITAQAEKPELMFCDSMPVLLMPKGQTFYFQGGEVLHLPVSTKAKSVPSLDPLFAAAVGASKLFIPLPGGMILPGLSNLPPLQTAIPSAPVSSKPQPTYQDSSQLAWDAWVSDRVSRENTVMVAALNASGLSSPIPGLVDLYEHGSFFKCGEYGTCWDPISSDPQAGAAPQSAQTPALASQSPAPNQSNSGFQPVRVEWQELWDTGCGATSLQRVSRIAHTPKELQELLRQKELAERTPYARHLHSWASCYVGIWVHHNGHYVKVVTPLKPPKSSPQPPKCSAKGCKPGRPPRPVWVRAGKQVGFVPRHPKDVDGKPPLNLKHGIIVPSPKSGEPAQLLALNSSQKISVLDKAPKQFQPEASPHAPATAAPEIRAHLLLDNPRVSSLFAASHSPSQITYNYKSQKFTMPGAAAPGAKPKAVAVGGIASNGRVASFADGRSARYAGSFAHSSSAASYAVAARASGSTSYSGGGHSSGSSSSYSGGGRGSGSSSSYSGGGHSSSSSSSSSGGSSSHSSGGGGGGSSSSASSGSSSSGGGGGGSSHH